MKTIKTFYLSEIVLDMISELKNNSIGKNDSDRVEKLISAGYFRLKELGAVDHSGSIKAWMRKESALDNQEFDKAFADCFDKNGNLKNDFKSLKI